MAEKAIWIRGGRMRYDVALEAQKRIQALRRAGAAPDVLLTVEHDPAFTRGRRSRSESFRVSLDEARAAGIAIFDSDRGGDVTYHGPGQVVAYAVLDLRNYGKDLHAHVARLEEAVIRTLARYDLSGVRRPGCPGVWIGDRKIASIGVSVRDWVTCHGVALNVAVRADHFAMIHPCGLPIRVVSMNDVLATSVAWSEVESALAAETGRLLERRWIEVTWNGWEASLG